ncbi:hypothetical protein [Cytobacillus sp. FSL H8-0458]|uniref:hypothetical protein n=1 Tax=Cytobacillus sp. FSL H8-0458 TaxID=2975346 RepID=UPI0030F7E007
MRYFTEKDIDKQRRAFYNFFKDNESGGIQVFNGLHEELTLEEVQELIDGLTIAYKKISEEEYKERTLDQVIYDVNHDFEIFEEGPHINRPFRKDLKRNYTIKCANCLSEISTKEHEGYWVAQNHHVKIHGEKFCSEWCVNKFIDEQKQIAIKKKRTRYCV